MIQPKALAACAALLFTLTGCGAETAASSAAPPAPEVSAPAVSTPTEADAISAMAYTEEDLLRSFSESEYAKGCTATGCVLADDAAYGLMGVVQYTDETGNPCNLSFINQEGYGMPIGLDADGRMAIASDSVLTYIGNGTVTLSLCNPEESKQYDYSVEYSYSPEASATNFILSSSERD